MTHVWKKEKQDVVLPMHDAGHHMYQSNTASVFILLLAPVIAHVTSRVL